MGFLNMDWSLSPEDLIEAGGYLQRLKMYPYFDIAHYLLACLSVKDQMGAGGFAFSRRHPFSCWLSSMLISFAGSFLSCFLLGEPIITPFKNHNDIILASIVWYTVFYSPFDVVYKIIKLFPVRIVLYMAKEVQRTYKISHGVTYAAKLYPESYLVQLLVGVSKGAGSGVVQIVEQLVQGVWLPNKHELLRPSFTTKACVVASLVFTLERNSMYVTAPHDLVYLSVVCFFIYFKLAAVLVGVADPLAPVENLCCAIFMGGIWEAFQKAIQHTKDETANGVVRTEEEVREKKKKNDRKNK
ncbi:unnamed protein product [Auanema sp. JU1783]|nr:unnamed protein product [Auanema sp. JU1783]